MPDSIIHPGITQLSAPMSTAPMPRKLKPRRKRGSVLMCQAYIRVKLLTGLRQTDMLRIRLADMVDVGMRVIVSKTARTTRHKQHFSWTPELERAVEMAKSSRPVDIVHGCSAIVTGSAPSMRKMKRTAFSPYGVDS